MEVGITPDITPKRVDVVVKKMSDNWGDEETDLASGTTDTVTDGFAKITL